jgi:hypothetical protein
MAEDAKTEKVPHGRGFSWPVSTAPLLDQFDFFNLVEKSPWR